MRLIDADIVIAKVDLSYLTLSLLIGQEESRIAVAEIKRLIREMPTVDFVEVEEKSNECNG